MNIPKAFLAALLYLIVFEVLGLWILIENLFDTIFFSCYYRFFQGILKLTVVFIFIHFFAKTSLRSLPQKTTLFWYLAALIIGSSYIFIQHPLIKFLAIFFDIESSLEYNFSRLENLTNINFIGAVLLTPISEELFFRQFLQKKLSERYKAIAAVFITSVLFALCHAPYGNLIFESYNGNWNQSYITFFGGLITGYLFYKSKSIGPPILMHISWNFMANII